MRNSFGRVFLRLAFGILLSASSFSALMDYQGETSPLWGGQLSLVPSANAGILTNMQTIKDKISKGDYEYYYIFLNKGDQLKCTAQSLRGAKFDLMLMDDLDLWEYEDSLEYSDEEYFEYIDGKMNIDNAAIEWKATASDTYYVLVDNTFLPYCGVDPKGEIEVSIKASITRSGYVEPAKPAVSSSKSRKIAYKSIRFFESGKEIAKLADRRYATSFPKSTTREICYEVSIDNLLYGKYSDTSKMHARYFKPDNTLFGEFDADLNLKPEDSSYYAAKGRGWADPGNWDPGKYYVSIYADGNFLCGDYFTIYDDKAPLKSLTKVTLKGLRFFETYRDVPEMKDRFYTTTFPKSKSRRICFEIYVNNMMYGVKNDTSKLHAKYFKPDGSLFTEMDGEAELNSGNASIYFAKGTGWDDPGKWVPGKYHVYIYADGNYLCDGYFSVYDDK